MTQRMVAEQHISCVERFRYLLGPPNPDGRLKVGHQHGAGGRRGDQGDQNGQGHAWRAGRMEGKAVDFSRAFAWGDPMSVSLVPAHAAFRQAAW